MPIPVPRVAVLVGVRSSTFCCFPDFNVIMTGRRSESGRPNGRHFQYRLRTLFLAMFALVIPLSWLAYNMQKADKRKAAVDAIVKGGGHAYHPRGSDQSGWSRLRGPAFLRRLLGDDFFNDPISVRYGRNATGAELERDVEALTEIYELGLSNDQVSDRRLPCLARLKRLRFLDLSNTRITDAGLKQLEVLPRLCSLGLRDTPVSDDGLKQLKRLKQLRGLDLSNTRITDAGLKQLEVLRGLVSLNLRHTPVTDAGLVHLECLNELEELDISSTRVTDAGLDHLRYLPKLRILFLEMDEGVTDEGVEKLRRGLPLCEIRD